ncbi:hypothetical protein SAMN05414139_08607 [Burkholderia sp. D7]|nr:hypothetical protein SAMN05414139_08607 [Burkholderia sp. D7]
MAVRIDRSNSIPVRNGDNPNLHCAVRETGGAQNRYAAGFHYASRGDRGHSHPLLTLRSLRLGNRQNLTFWFFTA